MTSSPARDRDSVPSTRAGTRAATGASGSAAAPAKQRMLQALAAARADVMDAIRGLAAKDVDQPLAPGKWCVREIVLHLGLRDRVRFPEWDAALAGRPVPWQSFDDEAMAKVNRDTLASLAGTSWAEALRLLEDSRRELLERVRKAPDEPASLWTPGHAFSGMLDALPRHDHHHAHGIRRWRATLAA